MKFEDYLSKQTNKLLLKFSFRSLWIRFCIIIWQYIIFQQKQKYKIKILHFENSRGYKNEKSPNLVILMTNGVESTMHSIV